MIISLDFSTRRGSSRTRWKELPENLSPKTHEISRIEQHPTILNQTLSILHLHHRERGRSGIWTVRSRFQIFRGWMRMPLKGTKLEKLRKEILSLNGPGQWSWSGSRRGRKGALGAPGCVHAEEDSRETRRTGAVWKSREVWRNLAVELL